MIGTIWRCASDRLSVRIASVWESNGTSGSSLLIQERRSREKGWKLGEWGCWRREHPPVVVDAASPINEYFWNRWIRHPGQTSLRRGVRAWDPEYPSMSRRWEWEERDDFSQQGNRLMTQSFKKIQAWSIRSSIRIYHQVINILRHVQIISLDRAPIRANLYASAGNVAKGGLNKNKVLLFSAYPVSLQAAV